MKLDFRDNGATSRLTITSSLFEYRRHQRAVDAALLSADVLLGDNYPVRIATITLACL